MLFCVVETLPMPHSVHVRDPAEEENLPGTQPIQTALEEAPVSSLAVPAGQEVQLATFVLLDVTEKFPAPHSVHVRDPDEENLPGTQPIQTALEEAPVSSLAVPAGQEVQFVLFGATEKLPAPHSVHVRDPDEEENLPRTQPIHTALEEAPVLSLAFPAWQEVQLATFVLFGATENRPCGHATHLPGARGST